MSEIKSWCRWGSWKTSESEFAGIRVRQQRDFSITGDPEDHTNKFITEAPFTRERTRQGQESLTAQELSMLRVVLGTTSWRAQQMSPQLAVDVSLLLSATAQPVVQDLLDANKLVRDMRRSAAQSLHFQSFALPPSLPPPPSPSRKGEGKGKLKGKSKDSPCFISDRSDHFWRQYPERQSKGSGKGGKHGSRTIHLGAARSFDSELFETVVRQADVVLDCVWCDSNSWWCRSSADSG